MYCTIGQLSYYSLDGVNLFLRTPWNSVLFDTNRFRSQTWLSPVLKLHGEDSLLACGLRKLTMVQVAAFSWGGDTALGYLCGSNLYYYELLIQYSMSNRLDYFLYWNIATHKTEMTLLCRSFLQR